MKVLQILSLTALMLITKLVTAQNKSDKYFFSSGIGIANSFFGTALPPFQYLNLKEYNIKKNTFGRIYDFELGVNLKKRLSISLRFSDHLFLNKFNVQDTITNTNYNYTLIGNLYRHQQYYQLLLNKIVFKKNSNSIGVGTGLFLVHESQQYAGQYSGIPNLENASAALHEYPSWEGGAPLAVFFERALHKNVALGVKAQIYYIISVDSFEALSLNPYIKVSF